MRVAAAIALAWIAFEVFYDLVAWLYTGVALGFSHAFLPWYAMDFLHLLGVM